MPPERLREIAQMGGRAAQAAGKAHRWTPKTAAEAGRNGGRKGLGKERRHGAPLKWAVGDRCAIPDGDGMWAIGVIRSIGERSALVARSDGLLDTYGLWQLELVPVALGGAR